METQGSRPPPPRGGSNPRVLHKQTVWPAAFSFSRKNAAVVHSRSGSRLIRDITARAGWAFTYGTPRSGWPNKVGDQMPDFAKPEITLLEAIGRWIEVAAAEVDDIGGWRDATDERVFLSDDPARYWADPPKRFFADTSWLVGQITTHHPKLDPCPLQDIYIAVAAWHEDHSAARIPAQKILFARLERSVLTLQAVEAAIRDRRLAGDDKGSGVAQSEPGIAGYRPADTLRLEHGIVQSRLSEAAADGKVRTMQAPSGLKDSQGKRVRQLYNKADALKHCTPKRTKKKNPTKYRRTNS